MPLSPKPWFLLTIKDGWKKIFSPRVVMVALAVTGSASLFLFQNCSGFKVAANSVTNTFSEVGAYGETVRAIEPTHIYPSGGVLTITGSNFSAKTTLTIGDSPCPEFNFISSTQITCTIPPSDPAAPQAGEQNIVISNSISWPKAFAQVNYSSLTTIAGSDSEPTLQTPIDGQGTLARFSQIIRAVSNGKTAYFTDTLVSDATARTTLTNVVRSMDLDTFNVKTIAGDPSNSNHTGSSAPNLVDGVGPVAAFQGPLGLAISDDQKSLYVADAGNQAIRKIDLATNTVTTPWPASSSTSCSPQSQICNPQYLAIDGNNLYVAQDFGQGAVILLLNTANPSAAPVLFAGSLTEPSSYPPAWVVAGHPSPTVLATPLKDSNGTLTKAGATGMQIHFSDLEIGSGDAVTLTDAQGNTLLQIDSTMSAALTANESNFEYMTPVFQTDTVNVKFTSAMAGASGDFTIDSYTYTTATGKIAVNTADGPVANAYFGGIVEMQVYNHILYIVDNSFGLVSQIDLTSPTHPVTALFGGGTTDPAAVHIGQQVKYSDLSFVTADTKTGSLVNGAGSLAMDSKNLYVADSYSSVVYSFNLQTNVATVVFANPINSKVVNQDSQKGNLGTGILWAPDNLMYSPTQGLLIATPREIRLLQ